MLDLSLIAQAANDTITLAQLPAGTGGGAGIPDIAPEAPPFADKFLDLGSAGTWVAYLACAAALVFAGAKMGWERWQGGQVESPKKMAAVIFGAIIVASAVSIVNWASA
ncbi:hypothetical protein CFAEC_14190 (plasmid) [Corynebacterium faecale]|uniref:hypothetical protein n=1 Tax=Corynebacterium faecale TaxID=1758466 RepID=UPI0025B3348C|nr:hypothetical protein [Corynebacterium faecale]WJY93621.1 hypothetical protein CFAEC_14190 [Corynebacterium faecale]